MFKITIATTPARSMDGDLNRNIAYFLSDIGYIPRVSPATDLQTIKDSASFRLFKDCFIMNSERYWTGDELMAYLHTSRTTLYRHLNKLKSLDILEESHEGKTKKYRLRSGDLMKAWNWVEVNMKMALENYRRSVDQIVKLSKAAEK